MSNEIDGNDELVSIKYRVLGSYELTLGGFFMRKVLFAGLCALVLAGSVSNSTVSRDSNSSFKETQIKLTDIKSTKNISFWKKEKKE